MLVLLERIRDASVASWQKSFSLKYRLTQIAAVVNALLKSRIIM
jgi:hypothetical protein